MSADDLLDVNSELQDLTCNCEGDECSAPPSPSPPSPSPSSPAITPFSTPEVSSCPSLESSSQSSSSSGFQLLPPSVLIAGLLACLLHLYFM